MQGSRSEKQIAGDDTERSAEALLRSRGLRLLTRNYRCRSGEIDLIMLDDDYLVFVEVRLRSNLAYVNALESVERRKQAKIISAAKHFLLENPIYLQHFCRFDVVASAQVDTPTSQLIWIKDAFQLNW